MKAAHLFSATTSNAGAQCRAARSNQNLRNWTPAFAGVELVVA